MDDRRRNFLLLLIPFLFCFSCQTKRPALVERSYYYWRTSGEISPTERQFLRDRQIHKLYVRILDVDWNDVDGAIPVSEGSADVLNTQLNKYDSLDVQLVPCIFITNRTFEKIDTTDLHLLALRVVRRCLPAFDEMDRAFEQKRPFDALPIRPAEIQFDCDWTTTTRGKYFRFLQMVRSLLPADTIQLSATIRLHQFRYPGKTGVPPVNRGMLMLYNITDLRSYSPVNSIYDEEKARAYFTSANKYTLPLDIVLPAYSWCLVFRDHKFYQIENSLAEDEVKRLAFVEKGKNGFYMVTQDTVFRDLFLRPGDEIKVEKVDEEALRRAAGLAKKAVNTDRFSLAFFELSEAEINSYNHETFETIYGSYH
jgi:hypothetical protein